jgi:predicted porin
MGNTSHGNSTQMFNGGNDGANKLGFKGVEDLGGGQWSAFYLESGINANDGASQGPLFNRRSTVSVGGNWGEVRLGRDFNVTFENFVMGDAFGDHSSAAGGDGFQYANKASNNSTNYFVNNAVKYAFGFDKNDSTWAGSNGLYGEVQYAIAGNGAGTPANGQYTGGRLGYASGAFNGAIAAAQSVGQSAGNSSGATNVKFNEFNFFVNYTLPQGTLIASGGTNSSNDPAVANAKFSHYTLGANINAGRGSIPVTFANTTQTGVSGSSAYLFGFGYIYPLSKTTSVYTYYSNIKNGSATNYAGGDWGYAGSAVANGSSVNVYSLGMKKQF